METESLLCKTGNESLSTHVIRMNFLVEEKGNGADFECFVFNVSLFFPPMLRAFFFTFKATFNKRTNGQNLGLSSKK